MNNIDGFCPSITESLLSKAISFAKNYTTISDKDIDMYSCTAGDHSYLTTRPLGPRQNHIQRHVRFDVTMGCFVCELIGLFLLNNLSEKYGKNNSLQRRRAGTSKKRKWTAVCLDLIPDRTQDRIRLRIGSDRAGIFVFGAELLDLTQQDGRGRQKLIL